MSHAQTRNPFCLGMLATTPCRKWDRVDSSVNAYFRSFRAMYSRKYAARRRKPGKNTAIPIIAGLCGTTWVTSNIGVTHNFYSKRWWEEGGETVKAIPIRNKNTDVAETVP